jgi:hypothetical protein
LEDDSKGKTAFQQPSHLFLALLTLTSSIVTLFFLSGSDEMATEIGSLAPGLDGCKGLRKTRGNPPIFYRCTPIPL